MRVKPYFKKLMKRVLAALVAIVLIKSSKQFQPMLSSHPVNGAAVLVSQSGVSETCTVLVPAFLPQGASRCHTSSPLSEPDLLERSSDRSSVDSRSEFVGLPAAASVLCLLTVQITVRMKTDLYSFMGLTMNISDRMYIL